MDLKFIMDELNSLRNEIKTLNDKIDGQSDKLINLIQFLKNKTTLKLARADEIMCKSANSINVIIRLLAGAQNISGCVLHQILVEAEALTDKVKSTTDLNFKDFSNEWMNTDLLPLHIKDLIIKAATLPSKNSSYGNPFLDSIDANISLTLITNPTISQTSSIQNTLNRNQSSLSTSSNISNIPIYTIIPSTSVTNSTTCETSCVQNTTNQNQISSPISSNVFNLSTNIANYPMPYADYDGREREKLEQEALRKKYRNKFNYLDKYKNINKKNATQDKKNDIKKQYFTNKFTNVNESNPTKFVKTFGDCRSYCDPKFDDKGCRSVTELLSDIQPYILLDANECNKG